MTIRNFSRCSVTIYTLASKIFSALTTLPWINIGYSPAGRSVLGKTVPEVLDTSRGRRPGAVIKTEGTVFPNTDRPRLVNNIFIFFYNPTKGVRKTRTF